MPPARFLSSPRHVRLPVPRRIRAARALALIGIAASILVQARCADINVFAAASLSDVLKHLAAEHQKATGDHLVLNLAASSTLARQIEAGAPADLFFSADEEKMDRLQEKGLIEQGTRTNLLSNTLVIVVEKDGGAKITSPKDLASPVIKRLALAEPKTVPAGIYAKEYLKALGLWTQIAGKVIPTGNVRGALAAVESGNVDAAMVYKTDALLSKKVKIAFEVPASEGPAIRYPVAVIKGSKNVEAARRLAAHLATPAAGRAFEKFGFIVRRTEGTP